MRGIQLNKNLWNLSYPVLTTTQNDEKLHIFYSNTLVILSIWTYYTWRHMYRWDECNWTEIVETCNENKQQNWEIFDCSQLLYFDHNIGMLHRIMTVLLRGIQQNKNFWNMSYPVLTTTQNDEKLHIFDSNSLVILSIWTYYTWRHMYRWDECNWTEIVETCNENKQQNWEIFDCSQLL